MATQNFKRNLFKFAWRRGKKITLVCFLLLLKRERKNVTLAASFLCLETPRLPACYPLRRLPISTSFSFFSGDLSCSFIWKTILCFFILISFL